MWSATSQRRTLLLIAGTLLALRAVAQVNAYAEVTAISGTSLTLSGALETYDSFEDGEEAVLMQMQDDVAGTNLNNTINFGDLAAISSAGVWEFVTIVSHTESAGSPVSVVIALPPAHVFHFGVKSRVQLISFPQLGTPDFTTTEPITALPWNGVVGGVVALQVAAVLELMHDVRADYAGFRGGVPSTNFNATCTSTVYTSSSANYAEKGEGVQRVSSINYRYARGKFLNGAGGGNPRNAGGGGGGHWTGGGNGGGGFGCSPGAGGLGGRGLWNYIYYDRFFMGGGGGGGQQNNSVGGAGGAGGGIVILRANELRTTGPCANLYISANGANGGSSIASVPDGAGGGGAGGTVFLQVNTFNIDPTCNLTCQANGGNGGQVVCTGSPGSPAPLPGNWVDTGGGGGGGAQGVVMCMGMGQGVQAGTAPGQGGTHDGFGGRAMDAPGPGDMGVQGFGEQIMLPVELLWFTAEPLSHVVQLDWATASERENAGFVVERSTDLEEWSAIGALPGAGNSQSVLEYQLVDPAPMHGVNYYRLVQTDLHGARTVHGPLAVAMSFDDVVLAPQPADDILWIRGTDLNGARCIIRASDGRTISSVTIHDAGIHSIDVGTLAAGTYILRIERADRAIFSGPLIIAR